MTEPFTPDDPRLARQRALAAYLWFTLVLALLFAGVTAVAPDEWADDLGRWMVGVLIVAPVGRLLWLLVRWTKRGDRRFAAAILALLAVMTVALIVSR